MPLAEAQALTVEADSATLDCSCVLEQNCGSIRVAQIANAMKTLTRIAFALALSFNARAEEGKLAVPDPFEWSIRVYRFPASELSGGFVSPERGQLHTPPMPPEKATPEEVRRFIKDSSDVFRQYLQLHGIPTLKGTLAVVDIASDTIAIRTVNSTHELIASLASNMISRVPSYLSYNIQIMEAENEIITALVKDASHGADHTDLLARLEALVAQGKAKHAGRLHLDTRSGQRASTSRGGQQRYATGFVVDEHEWIEVPKDSRLYGTQFEIDPVLASDSRTMDITFSIEHHYAPPKARWVLGGQMGARRVETQVTDFNVARTNSSTTLLSGMTKMLGMWKVENAPEPARANAAQAAFLTGRVVTILPLIGTAAEQILRSEGEKIEPTPAPVKILPKEELPKGMILRRFRVPPDFLTVSSNDELNSVEPFTSPAPPKNEPPKERIVTPLELLKAQGIAFPKGSSAHFDFRTTELVVCNTPENVDAVAALVDGMLTHVPTTIGLSTYIVQGDGELLRRLANETSMIADHSAAWHAVEEAVAQGKAKILRSAWLETRSGQRTSHFAQTEYRTVGHTSISNKFGGETVTPAPNPDDKTVKPASATSVVVHGVSHPVLAGDHEVTPVGFSEELDPVLGPDGKTMDIQLGVEYDYAPPTPHFEPSGGGDKVLRAETFTTDFHKAKVTTAITLLSGSTKLLSVWRPEGTPEFDNNDILQAAFLRADIMPVEREEKKAAK